MLKMIPLTPDRKPILIRAPWPNQMNFPLTTLCNIKCFMCGSQHSPDLVKKHMTDAVFDAVDAKVLSRGFVKTVEINSVGENLLHPKAEEFIRRIRRRGIRLLIQTNGMVMRPGILEAIASGPGELRFSIDGLDAETFEAIRIGASWSKVSGHLKEAGQRLRNSGTSVQMSFILMRKNQHQLEDLVDFAAANNVKALYVNRLHPNPGIVGPDDMLTPEQEADAFARVDRLAERCKAAGISFGSAYTRLSAIQSELREGHWRCGVPWYSVDMSIDGDIFPCCMSYRNAMGNIVKVRSFEEIWHGPKYNHLRSAMVNGESPLAQCHNEVCYPEPGELEMVGRDDLLASVSAEVEAMRKAGLPLPQMRMENIAAISMAADRVAGLDGEYVEVGVSHGGSLLYLLGRLRGMTARVTGIDIGRGRVYDGTVFDELQRKVASVSDESVEVNLRCGLSADEAAGFDRPVKYLLIDAGHSYESVREDLAAWTPKVVPGGVVLVHDFELYGEGRETYDGVVRAVMEHFDGIARVHSWHGMAVIEMPKK